MDTTKTCPGYTSPVTRTTYGAGRPHRLANTSHGVRCVCGATEPQIRTGAR